jgi:hypothetical protein
MDGFLGKSGNLVLFQPMCLQTNSGHDVTMKNYKNSHDVKLR